ncbi:MAG TPA: PKD domain-containing protein [Acidobacteriota bacterium]|jgi:PKD repeat protein|nr:PKD domain-containing protein [Acidobacteriota bacterium]HNT18107.1 PKD domain-containing protein [Acidobacteriota bacterium]HPA27255.1 PKD domain-containing protein [Acidobacteriota bacterium]HQO19442.1 PKD domain-containing protein [Acidobacteriota bacterium]HQQ46120.1 PKD domain-containing protein [Acidobacteriota bacterium]
MCKARLNFSLLVLAALLTSASSVQAQTGVYTLNGGAAAQNGQNYTAALPDQSCVYVLNSGNLTLSDCAMNKTGDSTDLEASSQYGINAGVLASSSGKIDITGGSVTTNAGGANGLFATGSGSSITMRQATINASGEGAHGVDATYGGSITLKDVNVTTNGISASAIATDFGGGTVKVTGGTLTASSTASESRSAGIYSTGSISVSGATVKSKGDCGGVIDGANSITLTNTSLTGALNGIKIWKTAAATGNATVTVSGGSITATSGDIFFVTDETGNAADARINLSGDIGFSSGTGYLVNVTGASTAGLSATGASFSGDMTAETAGNLTVSLKNGSELEGAINSAAVTIDGTSSWTVTGESTLTTISDAEGISGTSVTNITGNGYNVYYDDDLSGNSYLGGMNYSLVGGGYLMPIGGSTGCSLTCAASASPTNGAAPLSVGFTSTATASNCTGTASYSWSFGDGATSTEQNPSHIYESEGNYSWQLTVTVDDKTCEKSGRINVVAPGGCILSCGANASPSSGAPPLSVSFTGSATATDCSGEPSFSWDFGDGGTSSEQNPIHVYQDEGDYNWSMTSAIEDVSCSVTGVATVRESHGPSVTGVVKVGSPFRLKIIGSGFESGSRILINGTAVPQTTFKSASLLVAKKGANLKNMVPQGIAVSIQVANLDGSISDPYQYTRY